MQVEATYERGRLIFDKAVRLRRDRFRVRVELPDEALNPLPDSEKIEPSDPWLARLEEIKQQVTMTPESDLPEISEKEKEYMQAFSLREDR